ncbi:60S ribosomal protein L7 [Schizosaccharomyces japonicus yFS275]|uniref:60S ribosomal protein L7 n=1 Tax=Schizosaccharomyces japonicus (strain yFS275 / FY16936) TaxID=402676 RepID=B6JYE5_SCHJY|nr:60S ribosomal protein L7 [Schizosaccharomyces japonicus yFS275]EEB06563.2 60S ribosomal protein L7 [Schizosaccharomyces japonicus yFS275]
MTTAVEQNANDGAVAPETLLKKRKVNEQKRQERVAEAKARKELQLKKRKVTFKRLESFMKDVKTKQCEKRRLNRLKHKPASSLGDASAKLLFVARVGIASNIPLRARKVLALLRLTKIDTGVFVRNNESMVKMLKIVEPYVVYGTPSLKSVRELIYKHGYGKVGGKNVALSDNAIVEEALGKFDVVSLEDVIHEIFNLGSHFKQINTFLRPFKLTATKRSIIERKAKHLVEAPRTGFCAEAINDLIKEQA